MIKKDHHNEIEMKNKSKSIINSKYLEQQTGSDTPKKTSFKHRFIQWLKQLPLDERYLAVKVHAPGLSKKVQETLIDLQNQPAEQIKKDTSMTKKISPKQAKQIIQAIVLITDGQQYFENLGFDFNYIQHPDKLYELLAISLTQPQKQMYQTEQYQIQTFDLKVVSSMVQKAKSKQQMTYAVLSFLRGQIFRKYEEKRSINLEEERSRKKQFSVFWRNLSEQYKRKILLLNKEDLATLSTFLESKKIYLSGNDLERQFNELFDMEKNQFCNKIFKCKLKKSLTYFTDYHELIYRLWKNQLNKKKKRTRNSKNSNFQKSQTSLNRNGTMKPGQKLVKRPFKDQKQVQKHEINIQRQRSKNISKGSSINNSSTLIQKQKSSKNLNQGNQNQEKGVKPLGVSNNVNNYEKKGNQSMINNLLTVPLQTSQALITSQNKRKRNRNNRRKKSVSAESKETNTTCNNKFEKEEKEQQKIQEETSIASQQVLSSACESSLKTATTLTGQLPFNFEQSKQDIQEVQKDSQSSEITYPKINFAEQVSSKIKADIQEYSDLINEEANEFYERRVIAYERIQFMLGVWKIPIKLFGSCASGITIKNSDIDIAVDNSILNYFLHVTESNRLRAALEQLEQLLIQQPWVTGLKLIKTAAIPLIKLKVNTSIKFIQMPGLQIFQAYLQQLNREHLSAGQIHIDLTIETMNSQQQCNHLGIISTDQINNWIGKIKCLHPIVIIIKNYLTKMNLNITYEGGLNTYSMICMIVAFIKHHKLEDQTNTVRVFRDMLKFYVFEFDEKLKGINLVDEDNIFYDKLQLKSTKSETSPQQPKVPTLTNSRSTTLCQADLQIKDPLNNGKNMTRNCYSFPKIREVLLKIYDSCFSQPEGKLQTIFREQFEAKHKSFKEKNLSQDSEEVRELLNSCKRKLGNPFLALFQ